MNVCRIASCFENFDDFVAWKMGLVVVEFDRFVDVGFVPGEWIADAAIRDVRGDGCLEALLNHSLCYFLAQIGCERRC